VEHSGGELAVMREGVGVGLSAFAEIVPPGTFGRRTGESIAEEIERV
jgi:hypothetical protein